MFPLRSKTDTKHQVSNSVRSRSASCRASLSSCRSRAQLRQSTNVRQSGHIRRSYKTVDKCKTVETHKTRARSTASNSTRSRSASCRAPLSSCQFGTCKTVTAGFWPWLPGESPYNVLSCSNFARQHPTLPGAALPPASPPASRESTQREKESRHTCACFTGFSPRQKPNQKSFPPGKAVTRQPSRNRCRANTAHTRQSRPDSGLSCQVRALPPF